MHCNTLPDGSRQLVHDGLLVDSTLTAPKIVVETKNSLHQGWVHPGVAHIGTNSGQLVPVDLDGHIQIAQIGGEATDDSREDETTE